MLKFAKKIKHQFIDSILCAIFRNVSTARVNSKLSTAHHTNYANTTNYSAEKQITMPINKLINKPESH